jgi:hypothetical protein
LYGSEAWSLKQSERAIDILQSRRDQLAISGVKYFKFIVPEKPVVYPEYLPKVLQGVEQKKDRPAIQVATNCSDFVTYLADYLLDAKSYGPLYFRGDTHPNWLGAYMIYQYVINKIRPLIGAHLPPPIPLGNLAPLVYGYDGDVFTQISPDDKARLNDQWLDVQFSGAFEYCVQYELPQNCRRAKSIPATGVLAEMEFSRELLVKEIDDPSLPTAVIFRDSTTDFMLDLLAEHFKRTVFIWHRGEVVRQVLEAEKPDIVIHFMAERFVTSYGESMVAISDFFPD